MVQLNPSDELKRTPQQTSGPYVTLGLLNHDEKGLRNNDLTSDGGSGEEIILRGNLFGNDGEPVFNTLIEIWQPNSNGVFNHYLYKDVEGFDPDFVGFGRDITEEKGDFEFKTFKPGSLKDPDHPDVSVAPNIILYVHASGLTNPLYTRVYFEDEENDDIFLNGLPEEDAKTLIAKKVESEDDIIVYHINLVLDGEADDLGLATKIDGEEVEDKPDGSGLPLTYFIHIE